MAGRDRSRLLVVRSILLIQSRGRLKFFVSLKNHGADDLVDAMFDLGDEVLKLPMEEKLKYSETSLGESIGSFG